MTSLGVPSSSDGSPSVLGTTDPFLLTLSPQHPLGQPHGHKHTLLKVYEEHHPFRSLGGRLNTDAERTSDSEEITDYDSRKAEAPAKKELFPRVHRW